jgi:hypothetical protein
MAAMKFLVDMTVTWHACDAKTQPIAWNSSLWIENAGQQSFGNNEN